MAIYVALLIMICLLGIYPYQQHNSKQSKKIFLFLSFTMMALVLGVRGPDVGEDTRHYLHIFSQAEYVSWSDMLHSTGMRTAYYTNQYGYTDTIENGFLALAKIVHWFADDGQIFLFVVAALTCGLFAKFIYDNCENVFYPTYIFLCESLFMFSFNGIRQTLACAITIQAYTFLKNRKWKQATFVILLAALFHNVALIAFALFPIMLIKHEKESKTFKYAMIATIAAPILIVYGQKIIIKFFPRYTAYFSVNYWQNSLGGSAILLLLEFAFIMIMYWKKFKTEDSFKLATLTLLFIAFELTGLIITMFSRTGYFFRAYLLLFFPDAEKYFSKESRPIVRLTMMILLMLLYMSYANTSYRLYRFFW